MEREFTNSWFENWKPVWDQILPQINPRKILEIGSFEGRATCYLIDTFAPQAPIEIHSIDTWEGGLEHKETKIDMSSVERRFDRNTSDALRHYPESTLLKHKGTSDLELCKLVCQGYLDYFDFIYVDGSHQAPDVLLDAIIAFKLLRKDGLILFDDYLWAEDFANGIDPIRCPKVAIDAFLNINCRKIKILSAPLYQVWCVKKSN